MEQQSCKRCLMDTSDPEIIFDSHGHCNHCTNYFAELANRVWHGKEANDKLNSLIHQIKSKNTKPYDCLIGLSGGADSSYLAYLVKQMGLNPLAVHLDNGWNSELAVQNIEILVKQLKLDLYTHVIDWEEFKDLQLSFLKASTPDGEIPSDHAINAIMFRIARKYNIKYIISGMNYTTESIMPLRWAYGHLDWRYIKGIHRKFGTKKLKSFPHISLFELGFTLFIRRIRYISILNYIDYNKEEALIVLKKIGWKPYTQKHNESIYTRFYQSFYLPQKFNIDKRKAHYSNLILSNQLTRSKAASLLKAPIRDPQEVEQDIAYVKKKFHLSEHDFQDLLNSNNKSFRDYSSNYKNIHYLKKVFNFLRKHAFFSK